MAFFEEEGLGEGTFFLLKEGSFPQKKIVSPRFPPTFSPTSHSASLSTSVSVWMFCVTSPEGPLSSV